MKTSIDAESLGTLQEPGQVVRAAVKLGVEGVAWPMAPGGAWSDDSPHETWLELRRSAEASAISISSVRVSCNQVVNLLSDEQLHRQEAVSRLCSAIERAHLCGALTLLLDPIGDKLPNELSAGRSFETGLARLLEGLRLLRFRTMPFGVHLACRLISDRWIATPTEARRYIDEVNSPFVGLFLDLSERCVASRELEWIFALGHRIFWIDTAVRGMDEAAVHVALHGIRYDGWVNARMAGEPSAEVRHLAALAGRPV